MPILQIMNPSPGIPTFNEIGQVHSTLHKDGCKRCDLGFQNNLNGCCVSRGTTKTRKMIIGEAPGKEEDARGLPFTGPAGKLLDQIWYSADMSTSDWYITNVVKCRPIAEAESGKQNFTPKSQQIERCRPFWETEVRLLAPKIIVSLGGVATQTILKKKVKIGDVRGKLMELIVESGWSEWDSYLFPMLHPAALLHSKRDPQLHKMYRLQMWEDIQKLKQILIEYSI